jgi:hypothetical protein
MVPRKSSSHWPASLDSYKPFLALRLRPTTSRSDKKKALKEALKKASLGRNLFFWDRARGSSESPVVAACFKDSADPNPELEQMFAAKQALVGDDNRLNIYRIILEDGERNLTVDSVACRAVAQLRTPYAERLVHVVGSHVSRIGVDFVQFPFKKPSA